MKETLYVIATRGKGGKEVYLKATEKEVRVKGDKVKSKILCEWTEDIDEAIATFTYTDIENMAKGYFEHYNRWYIKSYDGDFS